MEKFTQCPFCDNDGAGLPEGHEGRIIWRCTECERDFCGVCGANACPYCGAWPDQRTQVGIIG